MNTIAIKNSFSFVKRDIYNIYDHIRYLQSEIETLKKQLSQKPVESKTFIASKVGKKVHVPTCMFAKRINSKNQITFTSTETALKQGLKACSCVN